jgi:hypothetical protein
VVFGGVQYNCDDFTTETGYDYITAGPMPGCADPDAPNYNPDAGVDGDSCTTPCANALPTMQMFTSNWGGEVAWTIRELRAWHARCQ